MRARQTALQAAFTARLTLSPPAPREPAEPTRQHDGSADAARARIREGVAVLTEQERMNRLDELAAVLDLPAEGNRAQRREHARRLARAQRRAG